MKKDSLLFFIILNLILILCIILLSCGGKEDQIGEKKFDRTSPRTEIVSGPALLTNSVDALFVFKCNEDSCFFKCRLDDQSWGDCGGSASYYGLSEGVHKFYVYAIDSAGNMEEIPSVYEWTIDVTSPVATFTYVPSGSTIISSAKFEFSCNEVYCDFECSIDSSNWFECSSPVEFTDLQKGEHRFNVKAKDGAGNEQIVPSEYAWKIIATVTSTYPFDGQDSVSLNTSIFLTFSEPVDEMTLSNGFILATDSSSVTGELQLSTDKMRVKFVPVVPLLPGKNYQVILNNVNTTDGTPLTLPADGIVSSFRTSADDVNSGDGLSVVSIEPSPENFYDFSTLRILFSEILQPESVVKGNSFIFKRVSDDTQISGTLIVRGNKIIFDPDIDLTPGVEYRLELTDGIRGLNGEQLTPYTLSIYPIGTVPFMELVTDTSPDIDESGGDPNLLPISDFTGEKVNSSVINSRLLGLSQTYLKGLLKAEVRMPLNGSDVLPMVIKKGQIINATGIDIKLGGQIDTLLDTGNISLYLITDSMGYITSNPYANINNDAHPSIYLKLDNCITAADSKVNSILNQDLINIGLYGEVSVQGETMVIDAFGMTELNVLGAEKAPVTLTLRLKGGLQSVPVDTTPPAISSIYPQGNNVSVGTSIIITFSEPVKESTLSGRMSITAGGNPVAGTFRIDGSSVIFKPANLLTQNTNYTINISPGIEDLNGNTLSTGMSQGFTTEVLNPSNPNALLVSSIYPGVPCVLINPNSSPPGDAGECYGMDHDNFKFSKFVLPLNKNITVIFTKPVSPASVNEASFVVTDKSTNQPVTGSRIVSDKTVTFIPDEPWITGREYELRLVGGTNTICDAGEICGTDGRPLNTDILFDAGSGGQGVSAETPGGGNLARSAIVIPFIGGNYDPDVNITLQLSRFSDTNSNGVRDTGAPVETAFSENSAILSTLGGLVNLTTYLSGTLLTEMQEYNSDPANPDTIPLKIPVGNWMFGTELYFSLLITIDTDRTIMRPAQEGTGYIRRPSPADPDQRPIIEITMSTWMNAVNDTNGEAYLQDEPDTEIITMTITGRLDFTPDGRMVTQLTNPSAIQGIEMTVPILGTLPATINAGNLNVRSVTLPVKK